MATKNTKINAKFNLEGAEPARNDVKKIRESIESLGDEGKKAAQKLTDGFENIQKASDKVTKKISDNKMVTARDATVMQQQFALLEKNLKAAFGSIELAPQAIQEAFKKSEAQLRYTEATVRDLSDAVDDQKGKLKEGGESWSSFGDAIGRSAGPMGTAVAKVGLVTAAFSEGWQMGHTFAEKIGTDFNAMNGTLDEVAAAAGSVRKAFVDFLSTFGTGESEKNLKETKERITNLGLDVKNLGTQAERAATLFDKSKDSIDAYGMAVAAGVSSVDALNLTKRQLIDLLDVQRKSLITGEEGHKLYSDAVVKSKGNVEALFKALGEAENGIDALILKQKANVAELLELDNQLTRLTGKFTEVGEAYRKSNEMAQAHNRTREESIPVIENEIAQIGAFIAKGKEGDAQAQIWAKTLADTTARTKDLTNEERELIAKIVERIDKIKTLDPVQRQNLEGEIAWAASKLKLKTATADANQSLEDSKSIQISWSDGAGKMKGKADEAAGVMRNLAEQTGSFHGNLSKSLQPAADVAAAIAQITAKAREAKTALDEMASSAVKAAAAGLDASRASDKASTDEETEGGTEPPS